MKEIVIIGGRGNGTVIASTIEDCRRAGQDMSCVGFLNDTESDVNEYPILGGIRNGDWGKLPDRYLFIYALSNVKQAHERHRLLGSLGIPLERFANVIHPTAVVSSSASLGRGVVVMPFALLSPDVRVGHHSQLYAQSFVGHDTVVEEMVFIANNASVGGRVVVEDGAHVGSNASILERCVIGRYAVVGLAAVVLDDVEPFAKVVGNPARCVGFVDAATPESEMTQGGQ